MKTINAATLTKSFFTALIFTAAVTTVSAQDQAVSNKNNLPALLMSFNGNASSDTEGQLFWSMENQTNCKWFVIERSATGNGYDSIGMVMGTNNTHHTDYTFTDKNLLSGNNYYRLRQVDMDNTSKYSKIVCLYGAAKASTTVKMQVYPNPAGSVVNYSLNSPAAAAAVVQVYNMAGVLVLTQPQQLAAGINQQTVAISSLKSGNYFLKVSSHNGAQYEQTFIKLL
jgi:lipopolysaccharide export LptBFGC system permease protein LptF